MISLEKSLTISIKTIHHMSRGKLGQSWFRVVLFYTRELYFHKNPWNYCDLCNNIAHIAHLWKASTKHLLYIIQNNYEIYYKMHYTIRRWYLHLNKIHVDVYQHQMGRLDRHRRGQTLILALNCYLLKNNWENWQFNFRSSLQLSCLQENHLII